MQQRAFIETFAFGTGPNTASGTGFDTEESIVKFFEDSGFTHGVIFIPNGENLGVWKEGKIEWIPGMNPWGTEPEAVAEESVIDLTRRATQPEPVATPTEAKVDYSAMTDAELKAYIAEKLATDNAWLRKGVVAIFNRQTESEKQTATTQQHNGMGFAGGDAEFLTSIAQKIIANRYSLTEKQLFWTRKKMAKYAGQLVKVVRGK